MSVVYEDVHKHEWKGYYAIPNENVFRWRDMLKNTPIYRAAGICSSGEVGFFGILPLVRRELVLIDHSYKSIQVAALKYLLLREKGARETLRLLTQGTQDEIAQEVKALADKLPEGLRSCFDKNVDGLWMQPKTPLDRNYNSYYYDSSYYGWASATDQPSYDLPKLHKEWARYPLGLVQKAARKLDRVSFLHGDLTDLAERGPFGLVYLSNALQHESRERGKRDYSDSALEKVEAAVKKGGYVILAVSVYDTINAKTRNRGWTLCGSNKKQAGDATGMGWEHQMWRVAA